MVKRKDDQQSESPSSITDDNIVKDLQLIVEQAAVGLDKFPDEEAQAVAFANNLMEGLVIYIAARDTKVLEHGRRLEVMTHMGHPEIKSAVNLLNWWLEMAGEVNYPMAMASLKARTRDFIENV